jgi:hypothetical protein
MKRERKHTASPQTSRRSATLMLTGALGGCGGGWFEDEEAAQLTTAQVVTAQPTPAVAPAPAPTPQPAAPTPGKLNRNGLQLTFSEDFGTLAQDYNAKMPLNGQWVTWLGGPKDSFFSRTLHQDDGGEQQLYLDPYILNKHASHLATAKQYNPFSLVDGPDGKVLRITARRLDDTMVKTLRDKLGKAEGQNDYQATKYWSSGCISTYGGFKQKYGVFEARVKISPHAGSWPAFWMLASDRGLGYWPPEIDVFDNYPQNNAQNRWIAGGHISQSNGKSTANFIASKTMPYQVRDRWHTIGVEWDAKNIVFYSNDQEFHRAPTPSNFHENMFFILNLAIVGQDNSWADKPLAGTSTLEFEIDWVRVWKRA